MGQNQLQLRLLHLIGFSQFLPPLTNRKESLELLSIISLLSSGVVAYVDVRSESDNRSRAVGYELQQLGATVVDKFSESVTHLVYKDGKKRTLDMALRRKIHLVSVLWVERLAAQLWICMTSSHEYLIDSLWICVALFAICIEMSWIFKWKVGCWVMNMHGFIAWIFKWFIVNIHCLILNMDWNVMNILLKG